MSKYRIADILSGDSRSQHQEADMKLMTLGYEGATSQQFFTVLLNNKVQTIVDVRELPISRKAGFSKTSFATTAVNHNVRYLHFPELGCPKDIRHAYRSDGDWNRYTRRFMTYLDTQRTAIRDLAKLVKQERCCLVCFEADPNFCHRSFVAQRVMTQLGIPCSIVHLTTPAPARVASLHPALA